MRVTARVRRVVAVQRVTGAARGVATIETGRRERGRFQVCDGVLARDASRCQNLVNRLGHICLVGSALAPLSVHVTGPRVGTPRFCSTWGIPLTISPTMRVPSGRVVVGPVGVGT